MQIPLDMISIYNKIKDDNIELGTLPVVWICIQIHHTSNWGIYDMTLFVFCVKYFMSLKSCSNLIFYPLLSSVKLGIHEINKINEMK